ncbi:hypothetical protein [Actinomadura violacea]|uniref:hypothetical protein n=1 Tax=Actinomadura violacea TaxID=2819934 RepID=UPI001E5FA539|nr:hypothetical protein [Actinomadura violacea]
MDPFGRPDQRLGAFAGWEFDQGGDVEVDASFPDRFVERSAQGGADPVLGRRTDHPASHHAGRQGGVAGGAGAGDEFVVFVDGLEHRLHVGGAQPVQADAADGGDQVVVDVGVVAADGAGAQPLAAGQPQGEPLPDGDGGVQDLAGADLAAHLLWL